MKPILLLLLLLVGSAEAGIQLRFNHSIFDKMHKYLKSTDVIEGRQLRLWEGEIGAYLQSEMDDKFKKDVILKLLTVIQMLEAGDRKLALIALKEAEENSKRNGSTIIASSVPIK